MRDVHREILELYGLDASKYEKESSRKLKILRIYEMIPSNLENKKKRVKVKDIEGYYYDNKKNGEVDYLIDDVRNMSSIPLEVKSGKDYTTHSALDRFVANRDYAIRQACVLSNGSKVFEKDGITYFPIYFVMFFNHDLDMSEEDYIF